jgi:hypothetical protein
MNPLTREIGYCSVMGKLGRFRALGVYEGTEGLETWLKLYQGDEGEVPPEATYEQHCLIASFGTDEHLYDQDREVMRRLEFSAGPDKLIPLFRNYRPGLWPWFINADEAVFLTQALQQAIDVATRFKAHIEALTDTPGAVFLVRVPVEKTEGLVWHDEWLAPAPLKPEPEFRDFPINEVRVAKVKRSFPIHSGVWEMDCPFHPAPIQEKKGRRPYFARQYLVMDHESGQGIVATVAESDMRALNLREQFLNACEQSGHLPSEVQVRSEEVAEIMRPLASILGVEVKLVKKLPAIQHFVKEMDEAVETGRF